jgi:hypothetical protein
MMELGTLEKIIANPGTTYGDWRQWSDGVKGFTGPLRREQFGRFPREFTYLTKLSATQFAEFITGEAVSEKELRVATTAAIAGFIHEWRLSCYKIYGFDPDAKDAEQSVFYFGNVPVLEYLQQARAMGVMEEVDADDDEEDAAEDAKTGKKMRHSDAEFALIRRTQFEGDISSNKMPLVLALCRCLFTQEEPDENFYISSRSIVRHLKRLHDKDLRLQQEELEAWVASVPVCRSDTMTDCTYLDQEVMVSFDTWAPPGDYLHRTPRRYLPESVLSPARRIFFVRRRVSSGPCCCWVFCSWVCMAEVASTTRLWENHRCLVCFTSSLASPFIPVASCF